MVHEAVGGPEDASGSREKALLRHAHGDRQFGLVSPRAQLLLDLLPQLFASVAEDRVVVGGQDEVAANVRLHVSDDALVVKLRDDPSIQSGHLNFPRLTWVDTR
ncbi:hypothetical protein AOG23_33985 [Rhizobium acidisoli]|nr:hypothetical protein AOG23_33985 [Rhizobium acidisoli]